MTGKGVCMDMVGQQSQKGDRALYSPEFTAGISAAGMSTAGDYFFIWRRY